MFQAAIKDQHWYTHMLILQEEGVYNKQLLFKYIAMFWIITRDMYKNTLPHLLNQYENTRKH